MSEKKVLLELRGGKTFFPVRGGFFNKAGRGVRLR